MVFYGFGTEKGLHLYGNIDISNYHHLRKEITGRAAAAAAAGIFIYFPSCVLQRCGKRDRVRQRYLIYDGLMVV